MLTISSRQMQIFRAEARKGFIRETAAVLRKEAPSFLENLSDKDALAKVERCVSKAESYGFLTENEIRQFISIQTVAGFSFDEDPEFAEVRSVLLDREKCANYKLSVSRNIVIRILEERA